MFDSKNVTIRSRSVSSMDNNVYVLTDKDTGAQVLIDAAADFPAIRELLAEAAADAAVPAKVELIVTTHRHWDHVRALAEAVEATGARTAAGSEDAGDIEVPTDVLLEHGDKLPFGNAELEAIKLRGHTPGSVALLYRVPDGPAHLFTGDALFPADWATQSRTRSALRPSTQTLSNVCSNIFRMTQWSTRDTAAAPRWAPSVLTCRNGRNAAGSPSGTPAPLTPDI